ncbi:MAG: flagellar motor protein MotB [Bdellovibrionales bacterium]
MEEEEPKKDKGGGGAPGWLATFADLMSLLLTFFILLLSFAEMDVTKYKRAIGSIREAFGVETDLLIDSMMSSRMEIQTEYGKGSVSLQNMLFSEPKLAMEVETLCELEMTRNSRETQELQFRASQFSNSLDQILSPYIQSGLLEVINEDTNVRIRFSQPKAFSRDDIEPNSQTDDVITKIMPLLKESKPKIELLTYADEAIGTDKRKLNMYDLSMRRSTQFGYKLASKGFAEKRIQWKSSTNNSISTETTGVDSSLPEKIDLNIIMAFE